MDSLKLRVATQVEGIPGRTDMDEEGKTQAYLGMLQFLLQSSSGRGGFLFFLSGMHKGSL